MSKLHAWTRTITYYHKRPIYKPKVPKHENQVFIGGTYIATLSFSFLFIHAGKQFEHFFPIFWYGSWPIQSIFQLTSWIHLKFFSKAVSITTILVCWYYLVWYLGTYFGVNKLFCNASSYEVFFPCSPVSPITNVLPLSLVLLVSLIKEAWEDWVSLESFPLFSHLAEKNLSSIAPHNVFSLYFFWFLHEETFPKWHVNQ